MTSRDEEIDRRAASNMDEFMEHGPGLRRTTRSWVLERCPEGHVLLGGLGGMGVGVMWFRERDHHRQDATYEEAPVDGEHCEICHPPAWMTSPIRIDAAKIVGETTGFVL